MEKGLLAMGLPLRVRAREEVPTVERRYCRVVLPSLGLTSVEEVPLLGLKAATNAGLPLARALPYWSAAWIRTDWLTPDTALLAKPLTVHDGPYTGPGKSNNCSHFKYEI
jgi:hypothetical protein